MTRQTRKPAPDPTPDVVPVNEQIENRHASRRATLDVRSAKGTGRDYYVRFTASNGEPLGTGETHPTDVLATLSRGAWIRAMIEVLQDEGYTVTADSDAS
jgi:hypothetical protein